VLIGTLFSGGISRASATDDDTGAAVKKLKQLSIEDLMEIEVTSVSKRPEKLAETPSAIQVITDEDIRRSGATSIPEALRLAGNLNVAEQNSHDWNISSRGFNTDLGNKLLVLIDGRTVYTPLFSGVFWDAQDYLMEDLDRIEVISGPGGTLWGANAVNGVINITTKSAKDTQGIYLDSAAGTELKDAFGVRYGGVIAPGVYFRVYGKYFERDDGKYADGSEAPNSWRMGQGGFRIDSEAHPGTQLTFQGDFYSGVEDQETGGSSDVSGGNLLGRWTRTTSADENTSLQVYYDRTHLAVPKPASDFAAAGVLKDNLDTWDLDFQHRGRWGERHQLVSGLGYRFTHDVLQNAPTVAFLPARLNQSLFSGFVQDEIKLREEVFLTLGAKLEHNDYTGFETEPNVRLQCNVTSKQMVWSAISRAVRTPSRIDRDLTEPTGLPAPFPESILNGGSDFESETVIAYEVGYRAQLGAKAVVSVATFYNDYDHIRSTTPGVAGFPTFGFPLTFENNLEGETHGVEFNGTYQLLDNWRLQGSYNFLKESLHVKPGTVDFSNALNETADPKSQFSLRSSLDLPHEVAFDTGLRWVDTLHNNDGPTPGTVPSYFELDIRIAWHPTRQIEISLVGQNLLHDHHPEYGFPGATREEVGRNMYAKVAWRY
jgi:iron complex outermembrane receptor protein